VLLDADDGEDPPARVGQEGLVGGQAIIDREHAPGDGDGTGLCPFEDEGAGDTGEDGGGDAGLLAPRDGREERAALDQEGVGDAPRGQVVGDLEDEGLAGALGGGGLELAQAGPVVQGLVAGGGVQGVDAEVGDGGGDAAGEHVGRVVGGGLGDDEEGGLDGVAPACLMGRCAVLPVAEQVEVAAGDSEADAGAGEAGVLDGPEDRLRHRIVSEGGGESQVAGGGDQAAHVVVEAEDPGSITRIAGASQHGLEEADAVLEAGVEDGEAGLVLRDEAAVEEDGGHAD
jgi:hypothetical protein